MTETSAPISPFQSDRLKIFLHALLLVAGFSLVFIVGWGGSVTALGQLFGAYKYELSIYPNGEFTGKPEDAFLAAAMYLED